MGNLQINSPKDSETKIIFSSLSLKPVCPTLWLMLGRVLDYDINVGHVMQPTLSDIDNLQFTIVAIEMYGIALSEISSGMSCNLIVQVPQKSHDDIVKALPESFLLKASS